ncbi:MAG: TIGR03067 domain-containing protein [Pirellulaceae bacterium]
MLRLLTVAVVGLAFGAFFSTRVAAEDESEKDLKTMAGDWTPVLMQLNGKKQPEELLKSIKLTIKGDKYNTVVGKEKDEGTLKLDATKVPREMDITTSVGENKGKAIPCIYEITGDELRVCYGLKVTERPTDFKADEIAKGVVMLITYKRVRKNGMR